MVVGWFIWGGAGFFCWWLFFGFWLGFFGGDFVFRKSENNFQVLNHGLIAVVMKWTSLII